LAQKRPIPCRRQNAGASNPAHTSTQPIRINQYLCGSSHFSELIGRQSEGVKDRLRLSVDTAAIGRVAPLVNRLGDFLGQLHAFRGISKTPVCGQRSEDSLTF
jgi:hypothetical protein